MAVYRELRSRNQIHGLFDGWRRTLSRGMYLWGPANAVHEVAKVRTLSGVGLRSTRTYPSGV